MTLNSQTAKILKKKYPLPIACCAVSIISHISHCTTHNYLRHDWEMDISLVDVTTKGYTGMNLNITSVMQWIFLTSGISFNRNWEACVITSSQVCWPLRYKWERKKKNPRKNTIISLFWPGTPDDWNFRFSVKSRL